MVLTLVEASDWVEVYVDGKQAIGGHSLSDAQWAEMVMNYKPSKIQLWFLSFEKSEEIEKDGVFPDLLSEFKEEDFSSKQDFE